MGRLHACAKSLCIVVFILTMPSLFSQQTGTGNEVIRHIPQSDSALVALIDSLEREHYLKAERVFNEEMAEGWMPAGFVSVQLGRLINYNHYEGFKPGVGLRTNAFLSELFSTGGFYSRSLRSEDNNYGAFFRLYLEASRSSYLDLAFQKDLNATGTFYFLEGVEPFSDERFKMFATESVDLTRKYSIAVTQQLSASLKGELSWNHAILSPRKLYPFLTDSTNLGDLQGNEAGLRLKWHTKKETATTIWTNVFFGQGNKTVPYEYIRLETQAEISVPLSAVWTTDVRMTAAIIRGDLQASHLYSAFGTRSRLIGIESRYSFATMSPSEFAATSFAILYLRASLQTGKDKPYGFRPLIIFSSSGGVGNLSPAFDEIAKTFEKGYFESGIYFAELLRHEFVSCGLSLHYRYGPYAMQRTIDNLAIKLGILIKTKSKN